eukprot:gnl/TRDRNA2_/TRDRNA2_139821_c1_seq1.p2 gnl/TRDRNA2_/TRDRNA2_139821_c1~~gnl/TRDRNA2_/TRDRNA2_139821_c1_seq1.p2  ORF type:complete len:115 (+),score=23.38 gnl/TRDRNA2_/TRDRNA2_139821_c1_seq1:25-345(+)
MLAPEAISDQPFFTIQGSLGEIVIDGFAGGCRLYTPAGTEELCREGWDAGYAGEYADFAAACLDGRPSEGPMSEAVEDLRVVCALFRAAESKRWELVRSDQGSVRT